MMVIMILGASQEHDRSPEATSSLLPLWGCVAESFHRISTRILLPRCALFFFYFFLNF